MGIGRRCLAAGLALGMAGALAACGGDDNDKAQSAPVEVVSWSWAPQETVQPVVDKFNATHTDIKIKLVKQVDDTTTYTGLRNAIAAGQGIPCLVQGAARVEIPSLLAEGLVADITQYLKPYLDKGLFTPTAAKSAEVQGRYYGIPGGATPSFMMINQAVYDKYGIPVPKTWNDIIAAGKALKPHGIQVMNLAGEDPSTLVNLVIQAGGTWYTVDGNAWKVGFLSPESVKSADIVQQLISNDLVANQTYQDRPALIAYFDEGKMVSLPTSTWQLRTYEIDFKKSVGNWQPVDYPQFSDATQFATPSHGTGGPVPKGCKHVKEATEAGVWMATNKDAIDASYDKATGAYAFPASIPDPSPWVDSAVPQKLFGTYRAQAAPVILKAVKGGVDKWAVGPNYTAVFKELQDQWALAVTKKITMRQLLEHMQTYTVNDLKAKGINVAGS